MNSVLHRFAQSALVALIVTCTAFLLGAAEAHAASFYMSPASGEFKHGCANSVRVIINTAGAASNAADIVLRTENIKVLSVRGGNAYTNYAGGGARLTGFSIGSELNGTATFATVTFQNENEAAEGKISFVVGGSTNTVIADTAGSNILTGASGGTYAFVPGTCVSDANPPKLVNAEPANGATGVALNKNISFNLTDETGVNMDSVVVTIEGITYGKNTPSNFEHSGTATNYAITINPIKDFEAEKEITVQVVAEDTSDRKNKLDTTYSFNSPLPPAEEPPTCEELGCISECPAVPTELVPSFTEMLKQPLFGEPNEEKLEKHLAAMEFEPEITCVPKTESEERTVSVASIETSVELPEGYEMVMDPIKATCETPFNTTINVPNMYEDVKILKCTGNECKESVVEKTDTTVCGNEMNDVNRKTIEYKSSYQTGNLEETTLEVSGTDNVLESGNVRVSFFGEILGSATVKIENPKDDIPEAKNPGLKIISTPVVLTVYGDGKLGAKISMPFSLTDYTYPESSAIFAKKNDQYAYVGGTVDSVNNKVEASVSDLSTLKGSDGKITLAVMGVICSNCVGSTMDTAYEPEEGSNTVIVLVHGLSGTAATFSDMIADIRATKQGYTVMNFNYSTSGMTLDEIVEDFRTVAGPKIEKYKHIIIVGHSVGSLVAQEALNFAKENGEKFVGHVDRFISVGAPNLGSLEEGSYTELFRALVNRDSKFNEIFDLNSELFTLLSSGKEIPRVRGVEYFAVAGTKPYASLKNMFKEVKHDGIVSTESATTIGGKDTDNMCADYWELPMNHSDLVTSMESRRVIENIIGNSVDDARSQKLGNNAYYNLYIDECSENTYYIVIGKRISEYSTIADTCSCGDNFCGMDEDRFSCPTDCGFFGSRLTNGHLFLVLLAGLTLAFATLVAKLKRVMKLNNVLQPETQNTCIAEGYRSRLCKLLKTTIADGNKNAALWKKILTYSLLGLGAIILLVLIIG